MKEIKYFILLILSITGSFFYSQTKNEPITLSINGVVTSVEVTDKIKRVNVFETYFWYKLEQVIQTVGGYQGQLLHGQYIESYSSGQLKLKGCFYYGQQSGVWKYWNEEGKLQRLENWKKNKLHGKVYYFKEAGDIGVVKVFKKGVLKIDTEAK